MKKINTYLLSIATFLLLAILVKSPVQADSFIYQSNATENSATVTWNYYPHGTITTYTSFRTEDGAYTGTIYPSTKSATISLPVGYVGTVRLTFNYLTSTGYTYSGGVMTCSVGTLPKKPSKSDFKVCSYSSSNKKVSFQLKKPSTVSICEIRLYKNGKKVGTDTCYKYSKDFKISQNTLYKYRIRYIYKTYEGKSFYGPWSDYQYFDPIKITTSATKKQKGCKVAIYNCSGVSKYNVYISKTSNKKGYKKIASVSLGKKKSQILWIKKSYAKKRTNYIKVVPVVKDHGNSTTYIVTSQYIYK